MAKFDNVKVKLVGEDGNIFSIMGRVTREMKTQLRAEGSMSSQEINEACEEYTKAVFAADSYDEGLRITMDTVDCFGDEDDEEIYCCDRCGRAHDSQEDADECCEEYDESFEYTDDEEDEDESI